MPTIKRQDEAAVALGASDYRGVDQAKRQIGAAANEMAYSREVGASRIKLIATDPHVVEECLQDLERHPRFDEVADFAERCGGD